MWDTAGQERYRSLIPTYLKNAHCVVHVFEVSKRSTLDGIRQWHKLFLEHQQAPGIIVANKTDLSNARYQLFFSEKFPEKKGKNLQVS